MWKALGAQLPRTFQSPEKLRNSRSQGCSPGSAICFLPVGVLAPRSFQPCWTQRKKQLGGTTCLQTHKTRPQKGRELGGSVKLTQELGRAVGMEQRWGACLACNKWSFRRRHWRTQGVVCQSSVEPPVGPSFSNPDSTVAALGSPGNLFKNQNPYPNPRSGSHWLQMQPRSCG